MNIRLCVVGLVTDPDDRLLLIRHRHRGWELPGGGINPGEAWRDAFVRETHEETGLICWPDPGAPYDVIDGTPVPGADYRSLILVVRGRAAGLAVANSDAAEAWWFTHEALPPIEERSRLDSAIFIERYREECHQRRLAGWTPRGWDLWLKSHCEIGGRAIDVAQIYHSLSHRLEEIGVTLPGPLAHRFHMLRDRLEQTESAIASMIAEITAHILAEYEAGRYSGEWR